VKKLAILGIVALLLAMGLAVVAPVSAAPDIIEVPDDYGTIQAAIDAASTDDTIIVHAGTYTEDLTISAAKTNLELKPADGDAVTIQGVATEPWANFPLATPNIEILASGVKIHGFTIESPIVAADSYSSGIVLDGEDIEIYDNWFVSQGAVTGGWVVIQTYRDHVLGYDSDISGLNIHDNDFSETSGGLYVGVFINHTLTGTGTVYVEDNTFSGSIYQGIVTERSNTTIKGNTIDGSSVYGIIVMDWGTDTETSRDQNNVEITRNDISGFTKGILIGHSSGTQVLSNISVHKNTVDDNGIGIQVRSSDTDVAIHHNDVTNNDGDGISLAGDSDSIHHNTVTDNGGDGISVAGDSDSIHHNTVTDNLGYGIHLTATSNGNTVHHNTLSGNAAGNIGEIQDDGPNNKVFKN